MLSEIASFNARQAAPDKAICDVLAGEIERHLPAAASKIWHRHPVWFLGNNPIVGYSRLKDCIRLMFWSDASFGEDRLLPGTGKFKDASMRYRTIEQIDRNELKRWLLKATTSNGTMKTLSKTMAS
jgi:Domain of unknown function (DU1801)